MSALKAKVDFGKSPHQPTRYELIDKDGLAVEVATNPQWLANYAKHLWPDQEQDEDRTGRGWDIQTVGADR